VFDVVICVGVLELVQEPNRLVGELHRVLKPDGVLVVSLYQSWYSGDTLDMRWFHEQLTPLGFRDFQVIPCRITHDLIIGYLYNGGMGHM
jgi:ubiquinone/menaquinone biosynthesis C-methylase UbiE